MSERIIRKGKEKNERKKHRMPEAEYVYMILEGTDAWGDGPSLVWTDPREAVKWYFSDDIEKDGLVELKGIQYTIDTAVALMLNRCSDYPVLHRIKINPTRNPWTIDR